MQRTRRYCNRDLPRPVAIGGRRPREYGWIAHAMDTKVNNLPLEQRKARASAWFSEVRDRLVAALETLEARLPDAAPMADRAPGRFERRPWKRTDHTGSDGGGGIMAMMRGRVFEKVGVHVSTVHG